MCQRQYVNLETEVIDAVTVQVAGNRVAYINNPFQSLFSNCDVLINNDNFLKFKQFLRTACFYQNKTVPYSRLCNIKDGDTKIQFWNRNQKSTKGARKLNKNLDHKDAVWRVGSGLFGQWPSPVSRLLRSNQVDKQYLRIRFARRCIRCSIYSQILENLRLRLLFYCRQTLPCQFAAVSEKVAHRKNTIRGAVENSRHSKRQNHFFREGFFNAESIQQVVLALCPNDQLSRRWVNSVLDFGKKTWNKCGKCQTVRISSSTTQPQTRECTIRQFKTRILIEKNQWKS